MKHRKGCKLAWSLRKGPWHVLLSRFRCKNEDAEGEACGMEACRRDLREHEDTCPNVPVQCPHNNCKARPLRGSLPTHLNCCPEKLITCACEQVSFQRLCPILASICGFSLFVDAGACVYATDLRAAKEEAAPRDLPRRARTVPGVPQQDPEAYTGRSRQGGVVQSATSSHVCIPSLPLYIERGHNENTMCTGAHLTSWCVCLINATIPAGP